ncbi:hypothetical protein [Bradyrhizobium sp. USDA 10063]
MTEDRLAKIVPRVTQLLLVALSSGATEGERVNAINAMRRQLESAGCDSHELVERIKAPPLGEEEMQRIFDAGVAHGRADEIENARRNAVTIVPASTPGDVGAGVNGYTWLEIVQHFQRNVHRLNDWERDFTADVGRMLRYRPPSPKQAAKIHDIFHKKFGERI